MKTSIATVSLSGNLTEKLTAIAAAGFDGIEIFEQDFIASDFSPAEVGRMVGIGQPAAWRRIKRLTDQGVIAGRRVVLDRMAADFHNLGELARQYGIRVGYEALCWGRFVNDHRDAWEVVRRADHPNIGLILDSFHTLARRARSCTAIRLRCPSSATSRGRPARNWSLKISRLSQPS